MSRFPQKRRVRKSLVAGILILAAIAVFCSVALLKMKSPGPPAPDVRKSNRFVAELADAKGMVLTQRKGEPGWREVKQGARFLEGDLVRTDSSGEAEIRYRNGSTISIFESTVFTVRGAGENRMEISVAPEASRPGPVLLAEENSGSERRGDGSRPFIELKRLIPYGRSLEVIGRMEPGNRLSINGETVDVGGDGSFKHFTSPFPESDNPAQLRMTVTDLSGRSWYWTATYTFSTHGGED